MQHSFDTLKKWYDGMTPQALVSPGVIMTDIDEGQNRIVVGIADLKQEEEVRAIATAHGVPSAAIDVQRVAPIRQDSLQNYHRPIVGGLQIGVPDGICSLGYVVVRNGQLGFLTNSHCVRPPGSTGLLISQPTAASTIGRESVDPPLFINGPCPSGRACRFSDAAFAYTMSGVTVYRGWVATASANSPAWNGSSFYRITGKGDPPYGTAVDKIGRTTGRTSGLVNATCVNVNVTDPSVPNLTMLCQTRASYGSGGGDSGGPVIAGGGTADRAARGIHWGNDGTSTYFSAMVNIEYNVSELGPMQFCEPSFSC